jgi:hypothetical protein
MNRLPHFRLIACAGLGRNNFGERPTLFLESRHLVPDFNQHISEQDQVRPTANRPMPGDDDGLIRQVGYTSIYRGL